MWRTLILVSFISSASHAFGNLYTIEEGIHPYACLEENNGGKDAEGRGAYQKVLNICVKVGGPFVSIRNSRRKKTTEALMDETSHILFDIMTRMTRPFTRICLDLATCLNLQPECSVSVAIYKSWPCRVERKTKQKTKMQPWAAHEHCLWANSPGFEEMLREIVRDAFDDESRNQLSIVADTSLSAASPTESRPKIDDSSQTRN